MFWDAHKFIGHCLYPFRSLKKISFKITENLDIFMTKCRHNTWCVLLLKGSGLAWGEELDCGESFCQNCVPLSLSLIKSQINQRVDYLSIFTIYPIYQLSLCRTLCYRSFAPSFTHTKKKWFLFKVLNSLKLWVLILNLDQ